MIKKNRPVLLPLYFLGFFIIFLGCLIAWGGVKAENTPAPQLDGAPQVQNVVSDLQKLNQLSVSTPQEAIGRLVRVVMSIVGSLALVLFIYAGLLWMTSEGQSEKVAKAGHIFLWTTLGLVALFASYAAVSFLLGSF